MPATSTPKRIRNTVIDLSKVTAVEEKHFANFEGRGPRQAILVHFTAGHPVLILDAKATEVFGTA